MMSNFSFGQMAPATYQQPHFSGAEMAHLAAGGTIRYLGHTWYGTNGETTSIKSGPFFSEADAADGEREIGASLARMGYRPPRWFEFWRWKEARISGNKLDGYEAEKRRFTPTRTEPPSKG